LHKDLPGSPYELFVSDHAQDLFRAGRSADFKDKSSRYPMPYLIGVFFNPLFGSFYFLYLFGALVVFLLGRELTNKNLGGLLAFSLYALSPENLLQYIRGVSNSGLCYVFIWASLLFFTRYLKTKKNFDILSFVVFSLLSLMSYHTGATALVMFLGGLTLSVSYSWSVSSGSDMSFKVDKKIVVSFLFLFAFYYFWLRFFDPDQLGLMIAAFFWAHLNRIFYGLLAVLALVVVLFFVSKIRSLQSEYIPLLMLLPSAVLVFSQKDFFSHLLVLGTRNYYVSNITLNNYVAQVLLTHSYFIVLIPYLLKKNLKPEFIVLRGWLIGIALTSVGLILENFHARFFDYSFPFMFVLFGLYWTQKKRFRLIIVTATVILLVVSQLMIFNDPFHMRRYYNQNEVESAKKVISMNLSGIIVSDLRTSALFSHLGERDVCFSMSGNRLHDTVFYWYEGVSDLEVDCGGLYNQSVDYVILSESMRTLLYGMNFQTTPLDDEIFEYYGTSFNEVYTDGLLHVYELPREVSSESHFLPYLSRILPIENRSLLCRELPELSGLANNTSSELSCPDCNVVLISIDTLRADHLSAYGYGKTTSPNIDEFARENIFFENAYSTSAWTLPSHYSIFTGKYPSNSIVIYPGFANTFGRNHTTLTEVLKSNGYETYAFTGGGYVSARLGFGQGFDKFVSKGRRFEYNSDPLFEWMSNHNQSKKFFLFIHGFNTHEPYDPPQHLKTKFINVTEIPSECEGIVFSENESLKNKSNCIDADGGIDYLISQYDAEIFYADAIIRDIFSVLRQNNLYNNSIIIITSDHGEEFMDHGDMGHVKTLYQELVKVPLIIRVPGVEPRVVNHTVSNLDLMPTVLDVLGISYNPSGMHATSMVPLLTAGEGSSDIQFMTGRASGPWVKLSTLHDDFKLIINLNRGEHPTYELYDLKEDPFEKNNLIDDPNYESVALSLGMRFSDWVYSIDSELESIEQKDVDSDFDEETLEQLKTLGYVDSDNVFVGGDVNSSKTEGGLV